jgi:hypothetical protein
MITKAKFKSDTSKSFSKRSQKLKKVDDAIDAYHRNSTRNNATTLAKAIVQWAIEKGVKPNGDINTSRNNSVIKQLITDVGKLPGGEECNNLSTAVTVAAPVVVANNINGAYNWVNAVSKELDQFKTYACMDALTFQGCINPNVKDAVLKRYREAGNTAMPVSVDLPGQYDWKKNALRMRYDRTQQSGKQAVCTSFAYLAAHVLTKNREQGPRVEIVAHKAGKGSHVYVLVGRTGGHTNGKISDNWDAVIVDAWAASLGYPCIYKNRNSFVYRGMTNNLELVMEREPSSV